MSRTTMLQTTTIPLQAYAAIPMPGPAERLGSQLGRLLDHVGEAALAALQLMPERDRLSTMSDARLRDIGLTRDGVMDEPQKPLWLG